ESGVQLRAYPALEDRGDSVALRLMLSPRAAERATRGGLARLLMLALPQQAAWIRDRVGKDKALVLLAHGFRAPAELGEQLARAVFEQVFLPPEAAAIRTRA